MLALMLVVLANSTALVESTLVKRYRGKHGKGGFLFTAMISFFSMFFFVITDTGGFDFRPEMLPYALVSGALYASASFLTYIALGCGPFALSMLLISYSGIFSILYGFFFLGDDIRPFTLVGIALMLLSVYLTRAEKQKARTKFSAKWAICISLTVVGCGMLGVIQKMQQLKFNNAVDNEYMIVTLAVSVLSLSLIGFINDGKDTVYLLKNGTLFASMAGISNGCTNSLGLLVNRLMPISIAAPLHTSMKIVLSFVVSRLIFKETFLPRQIVGVILGTVALILLNC